MIGIQKAYNYEVGNIHITCSQYYIGTLRLRSTLSRNIYRLSI